jgi:hypothetical protein
MDLSRRMLLLGGTAPERDYLQLDGVADRLYSDGAMAGYTTQYAMVTKTAGMVNAGADSYISHLSIPGNVAPPGGNICDILRRNLVGSQYYTIAGLTAAASGNYSRRSDADALVAVNTAATYAVARDLTANTARGRIIGSDGTIRWTFADQAAAQDSAPEDLVIGCATDHAFVPYAGTYYAIQWVATVLLKTVPTDAQLQAYAAGNDARKAFGSDIVWYATATGLRGAGSGPILPIVGTAPLVSVGPVEGDLVAL